MVVWVVDYNHGKGAWSLTGTRLPENVRLLDRVLVKTMAMTSIQIMHLFRHHRLIPIIEHIRLGLCCISSILGRVTPCQSNGHMSGAFPGVPIAMEGVSLGQYP
jgi:hypothetical protein